jgi:hypothetical protein
MFMLKLPQSQTNSPHTKRRVTNNKPFKISNDDDDDDDDDTGTFFDGRECRQNVTINFL